MTGGAGRGRGSVAGKSSSRFERRETSTEAGGHREGAGGTSGSATLSAVPIPVAPSCFLVPIGGAAMAILVIADITKVRKGESRMIARSGRENGTAPPAFGPCRKRP